MPKVIVVVDDTDRRDIEVCKGAMGWRTTENKTEILYLYEKDLELVGLSFFPTAKCNHVYCSDQFDPTRYIQTNELFSRAMDEKVAEYISKIAKKSILFIGINIRNNNFVSVFTLIAL